MMKLLFKIQFPLRDTAQGCFGEKRTPTCGIVELPRWYAILPSSQGQPGSRNLHRLGGNYSGKYLSLSSAHSQL